MTTLETARQRMELHEHVEFVENIFGSSRKPKTARGSFKPWNTFVFYFNTIQELENFGATVQYGEMDPNAAGSWAWRFVDGESAGVVAVPNDEEFRFGCEDDYAMRESQRWK